MLARSHPETLHLRERTKYRLGRAEVKEAVTDVRFNNLLVQHGDTVFSRETPTVQLSCIILLFRSNAGEHGSVLGRLASVERPPNSLTGLWHHTL
jgi:hypothetical protein